MLRGKLLYITVYSISGTWASDLRNHILLCYTLLRYAHAHTHTHIYIYVCVYVYIYVCIIVTYVLFKFRYVYYVQHVSVCVGKQTGT